MKYFSLQNTLKICFWAILFSCISFFTQNKIHLKDLFKELPKESKANPIYSIQTVTLAEALVAFYNPTTVFLDVRENKYYQYGHIQNALNLPMNTLQNPDFKLIEKVKSASSVIVYCNGTGCGSAYYAARALESNGIQNIRVYSEGWPEWSLCRLPINASPELSKELKNEWGGK